MGALSQGSYCDAVHHGQPTKGNDLQVWLSEQPQLWLLQRVLDACDVAIAVVDMTDASQPIVYVNGAFELLTGYSASESHSRNWQQLLRDSGSREPAADSLWLPLNDGLEGKAELCCRRKDGSTFWSEFRAMPIRDGRNAVTHYVTVLRDTTTIRTRLEQLQYCATHDALTGLANRSLFVDDLNKSIVDAKIKGTNVGVVFIDVNSFKAVNDHLGHVTGDELLKLIAARLCRHIRENDLAARLGGDEFALMLNQFDSDELMLTVLRRVVDALDEPYSLDGQLLKVSCSVGLSVYPGDGEDAMTLLRRADVAMYRGKATKTPFAHTQQRGYTAEGSKMESPVSQAFVLQPVPSECVSSLRT